MGDRSPSEACLPQKLRSISEDACLAVSRVTTILAASLSSLTSENKGIRSLLVGSALPSP
jgi:hypothetical protein